MKRFEISYSHFSVTRPGKTRILRESDLCENSPIDQSSLKNLIRREGLLEYRCKECGNKGVHQGKELKLQLDHENGVKNDNRLGNLRWLCPNCHTQTPTYARTKTRPSKDGLKKPVIYVDLSCSECSGQFKRRLSRVKSSEKAGVKDYFCSSGCKAKFWRRKNGARGHGDHGTLAGYFHCQKPRCSLCLEVMKIHKATVRAGRASLGRRRSHKAHMIGSIPVPGTMSP